MAKKMNISVIVTVLNEAPNIKRLIKALLNQTKKADEIIIVDGGSKDATVSRVSNFQFPISKESNRLKLYVKSGNRSVGRNYGIRKAKNDIIAVTDAGGYPKKDWLEKLVEPFKDNKVQVVSGYYQSLARSSFEKSATPYFLVTPDKIAPNMEFLPSSRSVAFRKTVWRKVGGYPERFWHNEDLVFDYNIKRKGFKFYFVPQAIVYWQPPRDLKRTAKQFFRFALGDAEAGIKRPKIKYIFLRYGVGVTLFLLQLYIPFVVCCLLYVLFAIAKNYKCTGVGGLFWLPIIQIVSDIAVMSGHICGMIKLYVNGDSLDKKRRKKH